VKTQDLTYSDGTDSFNGYLAYDDTKRSPQPGILVVHDARGLGEEVMDFGRRYAALGYVALCLDMYGGRRFAKSQEEMPELVAPVMGISPVIRRRANAGLAAIKTLPQVDKNRIAAVGYCFGGSTVLEMARDGQALRGVVSFHGVLGTQAPAKPGGVKAKVLVLTGAEDPYAPLEDVNRLQAEMTAAGADWEIVSYGGTKHAFTMPHAESLGLPGIGYSKKADPRSWTAMRNFMVEVLV